MDAYRIDFEAANDGHLPMRDRWTVIYSDGEDYEVCVLECPEEAGAVVNHFEAVGSPAINTAAFAAADRGVGLIIGSMRLAA